MTRSIIGAHWKPVLPESHVQSESTLQKAVQRMQKQPPCKRAAKENFTTLPADYDVDELSSKLSLRLWRRSVANIEFQTAKGDFTHSGSFPEIHAFLKDPIYGLVLLRTGSLSDANSKLWYNR